MLMQELSRNGFGDAFREMERLQRQLNRLFETSAPSRSGLDFPPINIWTSQDSAKVTAEIPGIAPEDLEISVVNDILTLRGVRKPEELKDGERLHRRERGFGEFTRTIQLPFRVDADKVEATFTRGVLHITLPRTEQDKPRRIEVRGEE